MSESYLQIAKTLNAEPSLALDWQIPGELPQELEASWTIVNEHRPRFYGLLAAATVPAMSSILDKRVDNQPYGLISPDGQPLANLGTLEELGRGLETTIDSYLTNLLSSYHTNQLSPIIQKIDEYLPLFRSVVSGEQAMELYESPDSLMAGGMNTGLNTDTLGLASVSRVVRLHDPTATSEEVAAIARRSQTVPVKMASVNITHLPSVSLNVQQTAQSRHLEVGNFESLILKTNSKGEKFVDFVMPIEELPLNNRLGALAIGQIWDPTHFKTLGCPALARIDGASAIVKLWQWAIDICETADVFELPAKMPPYLAQNPGLRLEPATA